MTELIEQTQLPRISLRSSAPCDVNSDSRPGLLQLKRHLGTRPYTLYGGFAVFRAAFPYFNKYRTYPPGYYVKSSFPADLGRTSEKNNLFYEHELIWRLAGYSQVHEYLTISG